MGKCAIIEKLVEPSSFGAFMAVCRSSLNQWIFIVLNSEYFNNYLDESNSTTINQVTQKMLLDFIIPVPPRTEQIRIVRAVEEWFSIIDKIEEEKTDLENVIKQAKSKILDFAIHGKLVPQDPDDEPAIELLRRINPDFQPCDNAHYIFGVPKEWCICRLKDLCSFLSRGKSPKYSNVKQYPVFAQKCNRKDGTISIEKAQFLDPDTINKWPDVYKLNDKDILINSTGTGTVGRVGYFTIDKIEAYPFIVPDSHVSVVRLSNGIVTKFVYYHLNTKITQSYIEDNLAGSTNQKELYIGVLENITICLPPYAEQQRIVAKIEELFATLDKIKESLDV